MMRPHYEKGPIRGLHWEASYPLTGPPKPPTKRGTPCLIRVIEALRCDSKQNCWHARLFQLNLNSFSNICILRTEATATTKLTRNQVELMQIHTAASENLPGFGALGISPRSLEDELEAILRQSRSRVSSP
jgi:hypothetical protein